jgi:hypothetical protein
MKDITSERCQIKNTILIPKIRMLEKSRAVDSASSEKHLYKNNHGTITNSAILVQIFFFDKKKLAISDVLAKSIVFPSILNSR